jgi:hypothetical protein
MNIYLISAAVKLEYSQLTTKKQKLHDLKYDGVRQNRYKYDDMALEELFSRVGFLLPFLLLPSSLPLSL